MKVKNYILYITLFVISLIPLKGFATENEGIEEFNINELIDEHIGDSHDFHLFDYKGHAYSLPLPVILYTDNGLVTFLSSAFHHDNKGAVVVEKNGQRFVRYKEEIYYANTDTPLVLNAQGEVTNARPLNFSITKNVFSLILISVLLVLIFTAAARSYKKNPKAPKGLAGFLEPIVIFVRDEIAIPNIGEKHYSSYMPYLLTVFFLIWVGNLFGLIPFFPFAGTVTNNILFTGMLAVFTLILTLFSSNKNYWKHIFTPPGVPSWILPIMIPVEVLSIFTKPFALMIRLFANMTAGHIIALSLISLIFIFKSVAIAPVSVVFTVFMQTLELLVAVLQAYVFTLLSALFIGQAVEETH
ncbi:F0F1 ATP synthase subunit A [Capnocytophaga sputigena]|uniref:F0F1 ATP synthase subunit A n=1 Tax=Capnocytophaga sputigena TaxID=1019 RepID=UPI003C760485